MKESALFTPNHLYFGVIKMYAFSFHSFRVYAPLFALLHQLFSLFLRSI